jgi:transposase
MSHNRNPRPAYPPEFRQQMVELVKAGRSPRELAKEFGCHVTSILSWVSRDCASTPSLSDLPAKLHESERAELLALRKENRQIKLERDILAKATAWFANKGDQTFTPSTR